MCRPRKYSDKQLISDIDEYLERCRANDEIPQVIRFAHEHNITRNALYYRAESSIDLLNAINRIVEEKQLVIEEGGLKGLYNATMSVFSLKQLGWKDKADEAVADEGETTCGIIEIPSVRGDADE